MGRLFFDLQSPIHAAKGGLLEDNQLNLRLWDGKDFSACGSSVCATRRALQFLFDSRAFPFVAFPLTITGRLSKKERGVSRIHTKTTRAQL